MSLTAVLLLNRAFLSLAADPTQFVSSGTAGSVGGGGQRTDDTVMDGAVRTYANGNTRMILGSSTTRVETLVLRALTPSQVKQVDSWIGQTCLFRDSYGRKIWGGYLETNKTDIPLSGTAGLGNTLLTDVALAFQQVTYIEGV